MRSIGRIYMMAVRHHPRVLLMGYISVICAGAAALAIPRVLGAGIDGALDPANEGRGAEVFLSLALTLTLLGLARGLFQAGQMFFGESLAQKLAYRIRNDYYARLMQLSFAFHDKQTTGSLMSRATADVEGIRMFMNMGAVRSVFIVVMLAGSAVGMLLLDVPLALVTMAFVPFLAFRAVLTSRQLRAMWMQVQERTGDMVAILQENLTGIRVVKAFAAERHERDKFGRHSRDVAEQTYRAESTWARNFAAMNFGFMLAMAVILWFGGNRVIDGRTLVEGQTLYTNLSPGQLASFFVYLNMMVMPVQMLGRIVNSYSRAAASGERLFEILDAPSPVHDLPGAQDYDRVRGEVEFLDVSFSYDGVNPALKHVNVRVPDGSRVALVGRPGSGKTTFAHLIPRFYDVTEGQILIDGHDVRSYTLASLRQNVGVVQQDVFIHTASIRDNVAYGDVDAEDERVVEMMQVAQLHDFIEELAEGYDTVVGERGVGLSGGQKQRLSLARALLLDPPVLVLDDSTSSVDVHTERSIQQALETVIAQRTTFIITNRFQAIAQADQILVFKDGEIVQRGLHDELVAAPGEYRELHDSQMRPFEEARRAAEQLTARADGRRGGTGAPSREEGASQ